ncbi:MAG: hypothetical protein J0L88_10805, partial [Xanthomonadales bacterium]|nr:hypothetical protein [Xanthomonadales bacterium]
AADSDDRALLLERAARVARDVGDREEALRRARAALAIRERAGIGSADAVQALRGLIDEIDAPDRPVAGQAAATMPR